MKFQGIATNTAKRLYVRALANYVCKLDYFELVFAISNFHLGCILVNSGWVLLNITTAIGRPLVVVY
jgi:hypothetical protein